MNPAGIREPGGPQPPPGTPLDVVSSGLLPVNAMRAPAPLRVQLAADVSWPESESMLEMALIYEDALMREWTFEVTDSLARSWGRDAVHGVGWKISDLGKSGSLAQMVAATSRADLIVTALYAANELPLEFYVWVDAWLPRRPQVKGMFLGLVAVPQAAEILGDGTEKYLRAVARKANLEFLLQRREVPREHLAPVGPAFTAVLPGLPSDEIYTHWGLNE